MFPVPLLRELAGFVGKLVKSILERSVTGCDRVDLFGSPEFEQAVPGDRSHPSAKGPDSSTMLKLRYFSDDDRKDVLGEVVEVIFWRTKPDQPFFDKRLVDEKHFSPGVCIIVALEKIEKAD